MGMIIFNMIMINNKDNEDILNFKYSEQKRGKYQEYAEEDRSTETSEGQSLLEHSENWAIQVLIQLE